MRASRHQLAFSIGGVAVGSALALLSSILIMFGVVGASLWWSVVAMVVFAVSHAMNLIAIRRRTKAP